jgi:hypothetical protein
VDGGMGEKVMEMEMERAMVKAKANMRVKENISIYII